MKAHASAAPIGPTDRVIDVLARDERLVDVFVRHASQFEKLRSPAVRRVMARLVTVEQAARMAGVAAESLVRDLNVALFGSDAARAASTPPCRPESSGMPRSATRPSGLSVVELDVRDDLRQGREPFSRIQAAVSALEMDQALRLRTTFEPVPLFAVLAKRGFSHESRQEAFDDWSAWFWRATPELEGSVRDAVIPSEVEGCAPVILSEVEGSAAVIPSAVEGSARGRAEVQIPRLAALARDDKPSLARDDKPSLARDDGEREVWLDVRGLEPPEPMLRTLAALETLPEGHALIQVNVRVPQLLLPVLAERGYACELDESRTDCVLVRIRRR